MSHVKVEFTEEGALEVYPTDHLGQMALKQFLAKAPALGAKAFDVKLEIREYPDPKPHKK